MRMVWQFSHDASVGSMARMGLRGVTMKHNPKSTFWLMAPLSEF